MAGSKYAYLNPDIDALLLQTDNSTHIARELVRKHNLSVNADAIRYYVKEYRAKNKIKNEHPALAEQCVSAGIPIENVRHYWHKDEHFSLFVKNEKEVTYWTIRDEILSEMQEYAPEYPVVNYEQNIESHLLVIDPADVHVGKLCSAFESGEEYNAQIAVNRVKEGVTGILNKVKGFAIDKILFVIGNDILHVDTPRSTTTSGTSQDTHIMWYDAFRVAKQLYIEIIEILIQVAPVHIQYDPSNHDYTNGFFLADSIGSWFHKCESVTINASIAHRKYFTYHSNLIGTTHGDGAKETDLALLMAHEAAGNWANCKNRYFYMHHIHHKRSKDYMSVCVEALRSPSGTDSWHHRNAYQHAPKAIEGYLHHKEFGQIARITHLF